MSGSKVKEKSSWEKYFERAMIAKGFIVLLQKQYQNKTVYKIYKYGIMDIVEIPISVDKRKQYVDMVESTFEMRKEAALMRAELGKW